MNPSWTGEKDTQDVDSDNERIAAKAFHVFDVDQTGDITLKEIESAVVNLHQERKTLERAMRQANSAVASLHGLLTVFLIIAIIFIWVMALLSVTFNSIYVPLSTMLLAMTFIFGGTAKAVFESILFIFVVRTHFNSSFRNATELITRMYRSIRYRRQNLRRSRLAHRHKHSLADLSIVSWLDFVS